MFWEPVERFLAVLTKARKHNGEWEWARNSRCKYVNLRVDMRDGHCVLADRDAVPITFDELEYQFHHGEASQEGRQKEPQARSE